MAEQVDHRKGRQDTDKGGEADEPEIVSVRDTIVDLQHHHTVGAGDTAMRQRYGLNM
jgi:hypothetical protein